MPREHDCLDDDATAAAGEEPMGNAQAPRVVGSDIPQDGGAAGPSTPRDVQGGAAGADANQPAETPNERKSPLVTAVEIENFKGIGRPVRIELRPITLLFGRNSAGKSTVLHALCYAHEILSHRNVDARKTSLGGDQIDLGGFRQFVHAHDSTRPVRLRFELNLRDRDLPELAGAMRIAPYPWEVGLGRIETGWVGLTVRWSTGRNEAVLERYEVGVDGEISATGRGAVSFVPARDRGIGGDRRAAVSPPAFDPGLFDRERQRVIVGQSGPFARGGDECGCALGGLDAVEVQTLLDDPSDRRVAARRCFLERPMALIGERDDQSWHDSDAGCDRTIAP